MADRVLVVGILRPQYFAGLGMLDVQMHVDARQEPRRRWTYQMNDRPIAVDEELLDQYQDDDL